MGGNAFDKLATPRMPFKLYAYMRDRCVAQLETVYHRVAVPHEAPGKDSHGDVDILVARPKLDKVNGALVGRLLGASHSKLEGAVTKIYAVPLPPREAWDDDSDGVDQTKDAYCQVDVHACSDDDGLDWEMLMCSYGDLMQIVGKFLRYAGLTANDKGLYVRVPAIEAAGQKTRSMVFLSRDRAAVLAFVGLDGAAWERGFRSQDELFEWCCRMRWAHAGAFEFDVENHNDRQRMAKRKAFNDFGHGWMLERFESSAYVASFASREQLREEVLTAALGQFDKYDQYEAKMREFRNDESEKAFWTRVDTTIPTTGSDLRLAKRALKRWVAFNGNAPTLRRQAEMELQEQPRWSSMAATCGPTGEDMVLEWIGLHWQEVYDLEKEREYQEKLAREGRGG
ncbi:MAG: hypothetical protein INR71_11745 [Terriglobus roseus]|nr:hypothetical protein [Terriglobus roseus]